jgi:hypothetical protein
VGLAFQQEDFITTHAQLIIKSRKRTELICCCSICFVVARIAASARRSVAFLSMQGGWGAKIASPHQANHAAQIICKFDQYVSIPRARARHFATVAPSEG